MAEIKLKEKKDIRHSLHQDSVLANTAILYYKGGLTQNEIANRLGVSRPTVINYLKLARDQSIVDIRINGAPFTMSNLSREVRENYNLQDVYVANFALDSKSNAAKVKKDIIKHVAHVGAMALHDIIQPGERIGVAWGETVHHLAKQAPYRIIENLTVCQTIGSMTTPLISTAEGCAISLASRLGAECHTLHAPAVLSSSELAEALRAEPIIKTQLDRLNTLTRSIFSVGNCDNDTPLVQSTIATKEEFDWYRDQGAVGVLCGRFIDKDGNHIVGPVDSRMIGIGLTRLHEMANGLLVAGGPGKLQAIHGTLVGGYVSHLVTDDVTATSLLEIA